MSKSNGWDEGAVYSKLRHVFPSPAHVVLSSVRNGTGFSRKQDRTADAIAMSVFPSRGLWMAGVEIKVSVSDWKKELANADKSVEIQRFCHHWYVAAPKGLIPANEVPETWGLIECESTTAKIAIKAPKLEALPLDMLMLCSMLRRFAESHVAASVVQEKIQEAIDSHIKREADSDSRRGRAINNHIEAVKEFQEASGIQIDSYNAGKIGGAVKSLLAAKTLADAVERIRTDARVAKRLAENVEELCAAAEHGEEVKS